MLKLERLAVYVLQCVAFSLHVKVIEEGSTNHSSPTLFFFFKVETSLYTLIPIFKAKSTAAQWAEVTVDKNSLTSCMWACFPDGFPLYACIDSMVSPLWAASQQHKHTHTEWPQLTGGQRQQFDSYWATDGVEHTHSLDLELWGRRLHQKLSNILHKDYTSIIFCPNLPQQSQFFFLKKNKKNITLVGTFHFICAILWWWLFPNCEDFWVKVPQLILCLHLNFLNIN